MSWPFPEQNSACFGDCPGAIQIKPTRIAESWTPPWAFLLRGRKDFRTLSAPLLPFLKIVCQDLLHLALLEMCHRRCFCKAQGEGARHGTLAPVCVQVSLPARGGQIGVSAKDALGRLAVGTWEWCSWGGMGIYPCRQCRRDGTGTLCYWEKHAGYQGMPRAARGRKIKKD